MPTASVPSAWQTYADELAMLRYGLALWEPAPLHNYQKVNIGDVGYIRQGCFHLLFSAARELGDRKLGVDVPATFVPLQPGPTVHYQPRVPGALHTEHIEQKGAGFNASSDIGCIEAGTNLRFESSSKKGAILLTKYKTFREDAECLGFLKCYMLRNYQSWVEYANQRGHMISLEDLLLITGHDMTLDFAMLAFSTNARHLGIEFTAGSPTVASASASVWGEWRTTMSVHHNCGPQDREPPAHTRPQLTDNNSPLGEPQTEYNQCVFLRGFRVRKRAGFIPTVIKAAAGPHDLGPGHRFDEEGPSVCSESLTSSDGDQVVAVSDIAPFVDPLSPLFRYIFENSTADVAIVHDDDLSNLLELTGTTAEEDMDTLVSNISPSMPVVELGLDGIACFKPPQSELFCGASQMIPIPLTQETDSAQQCGTCFDGGATNTTRIGAMAWWPTLPNNLGEGLHDVFIAQEDAMSGGDLVPVHVAQEDAMSGCDPAPVGSTSADTTLACHVYRRLPWFDEASVDVYLRPCRANGQRVYRCLHPECAKTFKRKTNARDHVRGRHLGGPPKLFECITCARQFGSEANARRHCESQEKLYSCENCQKGFVRKDYRDRHQERCTMCSQA